MEPLAHQAAAHDEIVRRMSAYFAGDWQDNLPLIPRWASLLVSGTGTGKTAVAAIATETVSRCLPGLTTVKMLRVSAPNWMPAGANNRGVKETIRVIAEHVASNDRTLLVVDEIDKLIDRGGDTSWKSYIRGELFDLLDGRWSAGLAYTDVDDDNDVNIEILTRKLRDTVFILGIGTFQEWFDGSRRTMGFGSEIPVNDELSADIIAEKLPRELANRFNSQLIRIPELTPDDYHRIAREVGYQLPVRMQEAFRHEVARLIEGAIAAKKGVRFLEECMLEVLINLPPGHPEFTGISTKPESPDLNLFNQCTL